MRPCSLHIVSLLMNFNPRTHVGCDFIRQPISPTALVFQSTHPRGVRLYNLSVSIESNGFQSTHPRGVRQLWSVRLTRRLNFNPRTHVGCDLDSYYGVPAIKISIHAPTWGATAFPLLSGVGDQISIHAPTWGATQRFSEYKFMGDISIHAPTWGATVKPSNDWLLGHKDNEFANENIIIINSVNIT